MSPTPNPADRFLPLIPIGLGLVMMLLGGIFVSVGRHMEEKSIARASWPSTQATVTGCGLATYRKDGAEHQNMSTGFKYEVDGTVYEFASTTYVGLVSNGFTGKYPYTAGQQVTLYYDPSNPSDQSLSNEPMHDPMFLLIGALCGFIGLPFLFFGVRWGLRMRRTTFG